MNIDIAKVILEFMANLAWPFAIIVILLMFRNQIKELISVFSSLSTLRMKISGQEFILERHAKQKLIANKIESTLAREESIDKNVIHDIARNIANDILSLDEMLLTESDVLALKLIHERNDISSSQVEECGKKRGAFVNLGTLTGLEHDGLISSHFRGNPMTNKLNITEKGRRLLELLSDSETYKKFVYK